jgi:hypothetical protein
MRIDARFITTKRTHPSCLYTSLFDPFHYLPCDLRIVVDLSRGVQRVLC